jgi:DNA-binding SARP family transcriptional activator
MAVTLVGAGLRPEVEVSVLGPVDVRGAMRPFGRSAALELVVYLALHPAGAGHDVWSSALWTDRTVTSSTIHSTASVARRALGRSRCGGDHLPRAGRRLRLAESVGTDVAQFARMASSADPDDWRTAMGLIRGRPLDGLRLSDWAVLDGTQAAIESLVVDTALRGATEALNDGRAEEAEWMVRQGLRASPYDERLYRTLLRVSEGKGDRVGMHGIMTELLRKAVDAAGSSSGSGALAEARRPVALVHPRTVALYQCLVSGKVPTAGV